MTLTTKGDCALCDLPGGMVSPPHVCLQKGEVISDEHGCAPEFTPLAGDHESALADDVLSMWIDLGGES